ncbi:glycosyltransferase family 39 protein [Candidatus Poribacteria bacterium]|nr:glycosyltransferase family 39 protein [Candidatus Poribacteria bacterium]
MLKISSENCLKNKHIQLIIIVIIGAFLRFWKLGIWSFWIDEVLTVLDSKDISLSSSPINPIPYLAAKFSAYISNQFLFIFSVSEEWKFRLIFCIAGILSILVIYKLGERLYEKKVGILAALFVSLSNWHIFWSQNTRSYILTFLFAALTAWFFYRSFEKDSLLLTLCALFTCLCLILSHLLSVVIVPALAIFSLSLILEERNRKRIINLLIFFLPFTIPIFLLLVPQIRNHLFSGWGHNEWGRSPIYIILTMVQGVSVPIAITAFISGFIRPKDRPTRFLLFLAGIPLILLIIASQFQNVAGYYLFWSTSAYFILSAVVCIQLWGVIGNNKSILLRSLLPILLIAGLFSQDYLYFRYENGGRPKWKQAFNHLKLEKTDNDIVVLSEPRMGDFYLSEMENVYIGELMDDREEFEERVTSNKNRWWFLVDVASYNVFDADEKVRSWIRSRCHIVRTFPAYSRAKDRTIHIFLYE